VPAVSQPIFTAGKLKSGVKLAEAQQQSALVQYQKTIQTAFAEVSNSLIAHQRVRESRQQQEALVRRAGRTGCVWHIFDIGAAWTRSSTRSIPIATCFRAELTCLKSGSTNC